MFTVVKIIQYYEDIDSVECVGVCQTENEANLLAVKLKDDINEAWAKRYKYIENYVNNIQVPELDYKSWQKYVETWPGMPCSVRPNEFKQTLISSLSKGYTLDCKDFDPPKATSGYASFYVVKIKDI